MSKISYAATTLCNVENKMVVVRTIVLRFLIHFQTRYYIFAIYFHVISICFRRLEDGAKCMVTEVFPFLLNIESFFKSNVTLLIAMITVYVPAVIIEIFL